MMANACGFCLSQLRATEQEEEEEEEIPETLPEHQSCFVDSVCNWGRGDDLLELVRDWFKRGKCFFDV